MADRRLAAGLSLATAAALAACGQKPPDTLPGVVEAEAVRVAPPAPGRLVELAVQRGQSVAAGAPLFRVESPDDAAQLAEAQARVLQQSALRADIATGKRPDELAVTQAQLAQARTALAEAQAQLTRERGLAAQGFVSGTRLDTLVAQRDEAAARVREMEAQQRVGKLGGRTDAQRAAEAAVAAADAQVKQVQAQLADKAVRAPVAALVDDTLFRVGEWVAAGTPVVNLLPPGALKLRFFVAEPALPRAQVGRDVTVACDGCGAPFPARIRFVSTSAEFTPPVIYSREQRARLVYLVEAVPSVEQAAKLRAGQPIDVTLPPP